MGINKPLFTIVENLFDNPAFFKKNVEKIFFWYHEKY